MALKLTIYKNHLPACPSPYVVRSESSAVVDFDRFVDLMSRYPTTLSKADIVAAMALYREILVLQLAEGKTVKTPTGSFCLFAAGTMDAVDEAFLPKDQDKNHEVRLHHRADKAFEDEVLLDLQLEREERPDLGAPKLKSADPAGGDQGTPLSPGGIVSLKGLRLRFDPKDLKQGLFFVSAGGEETRSPYYPLILPASVMAGVPEALAAGGYALVFRAAVNGKDIKESRLDGVTLAAP
jgi:hypothetical protein